ncbi:hypothetical protein [Streptomyces spiramenti]|uniref:Lipoprotein n=1 Tax=Streptomyces spiramenti TaxID=2720606 RepID=A0ABX1AV33_9ACTN|nr:hypothetical protein [Streptomyces spiramenti]NJP68267.1 hypothetical protein [Streptomyces spiramenti]
MTPKKSVLTAAMVGAFVLGATACGSDSGHFDGKAPEEIAEEARQAMVGLESVTISSDLVSQGQEVSLQASIASDGSCEGSFTAESMSAEFISVDGSEYLKADEEFWQGEGMDAAEVGGKWIKGPEGEMSLTGQFCDLEQILGEMSESDIESGDWESVDGVTIDGTETVGIRSTEDEEAGTTDLYIADSEDAHVLRSVRSGEVEGTVEFSDFNSDFDISAPSDAVDMSEIG